MMQSKFSGRVLVLSVLLGVAFACPGARAQWENVGSPGFSVGTITYASLAFYNGEPYVAYKDGRNGNRASVMRYTGGSRQLVGSAGFSAGTTASSGGMTYYVRAYATNSTARAVRKIRKEQIR